MPISEEVEAAAGTLCIYQTPCSERPCRYCCNKARVALEAAEKVRESKAKEACTHPHKIGSGNVFTDANGLSRFEWYCPMCGQSDHGETPPRESQP